MSEALEEPRREAADCTLCELHGPATQTVFGAGPPSAWLVLVGEQPGDREDLAGAPFVGPAGRLVDTALQRAGIDRDEVYVTNAVKHFRFERDGNRRLHKTPAVGHIRACRPWLDGELAPVRPAAVATLGATAAKALLGSTFRITAERAGSARGRASSSSPSCTRRPSCTPRPRLATRRSAPSSTTCGWSLVSAADRRERFRSGHPGMAPPGVTGKTRGHPRTRPGMRTR